MFFISVRKHGWSAHALSSIDRVYDASSDAAASEAMPPGQQALAWKGRASFDEGDVPTAWSRLPHHDVLRRVRGTSLLVLVHGYNTSCQRAQQAFGQILDRLSEVAPGAYDAAVVFTWPGGDSQYSYPWAKRRIPEVARRLRWWMDRLSAQAACVDLFCHSLGNAIGHQAMRSPTAPAVRNVFAVAPALRLSRLEQEVPAGLGYDHLYLFHTERDAALGRWFPMIEWDRAAGHTVPDALRERLAEHNVTTVDCADAVSSHTAYSQSEAFFGVLGDVLNDVALPPALTLSPSVDPSAASPARPPGSRDQQNLQ
jgi:hypothetical protein